MRSASEGSHALSPVRHSAKQQFVVKLLIISFIPRFRIVLLNSSCHKLFESTRRQDATAPPGITGRKKSRTRTAGTLAQSSGATLVRGIELGLVVLGAGCGIRTTNACGIGTAEVAGVGGEQRFGLSEVLPSLKEFQNSEVFLLLIFPVDCQKWPDGWVRTLGSSDGRVWVCHFQ